MPMTSRRAPKRDGTRTTLRIPPELVELADRLAHELKISRNDALIRLALDGAARLDRAREIEAIRQARWAALVATHAGRGGPDAEYPSLEEMREAVRAVRRELAGE